MKALRFCAACACAPCVLLFWACGGSDNTQIDASTDSPGSDQTTGDATNDATGDTANDTANDVNDASDARSDVGDAGPDCSKLVGGQQFQCQGKVCANSVTEYCLNFGGGMCIPTPAECQCSGMHDCNCMLAHIKNPCDGGQPKCVGGQMYTQVYITCQ